MWQKSNKSEERRLNVQVYPEVHEFVLDARRPLGHRDCLPEGHVAAICQHILCNRLPTSINIAVRKFNAALWILAMHLVLEEDRKHLATHTCTKHCCSAMHPVLGCESSIGVTM